MNSTERHGPRPGDTVYRALPVELRASKGDGGELRIEGVGAPYESETTLWEGRWFTEKETYARGCFAESIRSTPAISAFNHDVSLVLGRTQNSTLRLTDTDEGLRYSILLDAEDPEAVRIHRLVERGTVFGSSCRFRVEEGEETVEERDGDHKVYRYRITRATLREVGPVVEPAYPDATAVSRCRLADARASYRDFLRSIRVPG